MPTYEYQCKSCDYEFDKLMSISDRALPITQPCPECGASEVSKVIRTPTPTKFHVGVSDFKNRHSEDFKENMKLISKGSPGNNMPDL